VYHTPVAAGDSAIRLLAISSAMTDTSERTSYVEYHQCTKIFSTAIKYFMISEVA
jgi:hypothetical protein